jgi:isoleucyl-tRNA synthetase
MRQRFGDKAVPTDLYLEGSDQHRGWFQHSLLPSLGVTGQPAFKTVLTHGFMLDKNGRAMSKSIGNTIEVADLLKELGADVCRWWVSSLNTDNDIKTDLDFFKVAGEEYRKVRNTIRFLLSNLSDYELGESMAVTGNSIDAWALTELATLIKRVREDYERLHFRGVREAIFNFCNETMSAVYLAAVKDRLYCDAADSPRRRQTQQVMYIISDALIRLVAPILPHTADEAWRVVHGEDACVHLEQLPDAPEIDSDIDWPKVINLRDQWLKAIEDKRQQSDIDNPLDMGVRAKAPQGIDLTDLADLCGVSRFEAIDSDAIEMVDLRDQPRCERSWKRDGTVKLRSDGGMLSDRDAAALDLI